MYWKMNRDIAQMKTTRPEIIDMVRAFYAYRLWRYRLQRPAQQKAG